MSSFQSNLFSTNTRSLQIHQPGDFLIEQAPINDVATHSLESTLRHIFPEPKEETKLARARRVLGDIAINKSDDELISNLAQFQHLLESWFNEFEQNIFEGKTLSEILKGGYYGGSKPNTDQQSE